MTLKRIEVHGESRRRFFLLAEVTFRDGDENYYRDDELWGQIQGWINRAVDDRDDSPSVRLLSIPEILNVDVESIARGDYPNHTDETS